MGLFSRKKKLPTKIEVGDRVKTRAGSYRGFYKTSKEGFVESIDESGKCHLLMIDRLKNGDEEEGGGGIFRYEDLTFVSRGS